MTNPFFISEWREDTGIDWWNEGRNRLNAVIRSFNQWNRDRMVSGAYSSDEGRRLLALVEEGRQTWAAVDGGSGWMEELERMEFFIKLVISWE